MVFRRTRRRFTRRTSFRRRTGGARTRGPVKEPLWRMANFAIAVQHTLDEPGFVYNFQRIILNPRLLLEAGAGVPAAVQNVTQSLKGVHVGGIVWKTTMVVQRASTGAETFLSAQVRAQELLYTQYVGEDGLPPGFPDWEATWRPISALGSEFTPKDGEGDLVRVHHRKLALLANADNAFGPVAGEASAYPQAFTVSTEGLGGWGSNSLRLKRMVTDDQQLVFHHVFATGSNVSVANPTLIAVHCFGHIYYRLGW